MNREEYNTCISGRLKGKQYSKEERKVQFCIASKLCAGKAGSAEEAERLCLEPKPDKAPKTKKTSQPCEVDAKKLAHCMIKKVDMGQLFNESTAELAIANALSECA